MRNRINVAFFVVVILSILSGCSKPADIELSPGIGQELVESGTLPQTPDAGFQKAVFTESRHVRSNDYGATFNTWTATVGEINLHIKNNVFDDDIAQEILQKLLVLHDDIESVFPGSLEEIYIYVVDNTLSGYPAAYGNKVYLTIDDINGERCNKDIIAAFLRITEPWQAAGILGYIDSQRTDDVFLKEYYSNTDNLHTLSLFAAYFFPDFSDELTMKAAGETAVSYTRFLLATCDLKTYLAEAYSSENRSLWLESLGLESQYQTQYDISFCNGARYSSSKNYSLIITLSDIPHVFYLNPITNEVSNAEGLVAFLAGYQLGMEAILEKIGREAPSASPEILNNWNKPIHYRFDSNTLLSHATGDREAWINEPDDIWHETMHLLIPESSLSWQVWLSEGLATYFTISFDKVRFVGELFDYLTNDDYYADFLLGDDLVFRELLISYYASQKALPASLDSFDSFMFVEAAGVARMVNPNLVLVFPMNIATRTLQERRLQVIGLSSTMVPATDGLELSYAEALAFTKFLVDTYGIDRVLTVFLDRTRFEDAFGWSFYEELELFRSSLVSLIR